jgi:hypothetical protein
MILRLLPTLLLLCALLPTASAEETILRFHSEIQVEPGGGMVVEETIQVRAEGKKIKRGIYRDFPTDYKDRMGNRYRVGFDLLAVRRDGSSEPYHTERQGNGIRIYIGDRDRYLKKGLHSYTLRYTTNRQLGFFDDRDELYWNVTGNGWDFPIQQASAQVILPEAILPEELRLKGYTGPQGAKGSDYQALVESGGEALFETTHPLGRKEGLTIVVGWPKGHVLEPAREQRTRWFLQDNREALAGAGGLALLLLYYMITWVRVGRDPQAGVIVPLYAPPKGFSPASMRFISRMSHDNKGFAAAIVNLAAGGYLTISEDKSGEFTLEKTGRNARVARGEGAIASALFGSGRNRITLKQKNHSIIAKAIKVHKRSLQGDYEATYFLTNSGYLMPGIIITVALLAAGILLLPSGEQRGLALFLVVWLSIWTVATFALLVAAFNSWKAVREGAGIGKAVGTTLFSIPFLAAEIAVLWVFSTQVSTPLALALGAGLAINIFFYQWLKAPTLAGRRLLDRIEGFRLFLSVAEKDELNFKHPLDKTPELFEKYLPYALALDVEQAWAEKFAGVLASAQLDGRSYHPHWYHGSSWNSSNLTGLTGAMTSAIASSSTAPGSSSGGGGGSSGGGGGGGGGGGW